MQERAGCASEVAFSGPGVPDPAAAPTPLQIGSGNFGSALVRILGANALRHKVFDDEACARARPATAPAHRDGRAYLTQRTRSPGRPGVAQAQRPLAQLCWGAAPPFPPQPSDPFHARARNAREPAVPARGAGAHVRVRGDYRRQAANRDHQHDPREREVPEGCQVHAQRQGGARPGGGRQGRDDDLLLPASPVPQAAYAHHQGVRRAWRQGPVRHQGHRLRRDWSAQPVGAARRRQWRRERAAGAVRGRWQGLGATRQP